MNLKRVLTTLIGLPVVGALLILGNTYVIDFFLLAVAIICMHEYFGVIEKVSHPIKWIGYLSTIIVAIPAFLSIEVLMKTIIFSIPIILLILFLKVIITNMETTFKDVAYTLVGIMYITIFFMFLELIRKLEHGKVLFAYTFVISWSTDIFAYIVGKHFGKHNFSKISPKKTTEGCVAGIIGAIIIGIVYMLISSKFWGLNVDSYLIVAIVTGILSVVSQIGDFVASSIKRFADIKDYGNLIPGHGGMLDRIDSLIFIAPFAYMFFSMIV